MERGRRAKQLFLRFDTLQQFFGVEQPALATIGKTMQLENQKRKELRRGRVLFGGYDATEPFQFLF